MTTKKTKIPKVNLSLSEKQQIERIFEPLLSEAFGGNKYHQYTTSRAKEIIEEHVNKSMQGKNLSDKVEIEIANKMKKIQTAGSLIKILEIISELCLLEEELSDK